MTTPLTPLQLAERLDARVAEYAELAAASLSARLMAQAAMTIRELVEE